MTMPTINELKKQVKEYLDSAPSVSFAADSAFKAATLSLDTLKAITSSPDCTGIRIYMSKDDTGAIWPIVVPVQRSGEGADAIYTDLIEDGKSPLSDGQVANFDCRNPPCINSNSGAKLLP